MKIFRETTVHETSGPAYRSVRNANPLYRSIVSIAHSHVNISPDRLVFRTTRLGKHSYLSSVKYSLFARAQLLFDKRVTSRTNVAKIRDLRVTGSRLLDSARN